MGAWLPIARALHPNASLRIIDEATSAFEPKACA